ncbi:MAG: prepilin-type N-terminal cleavage/methylation domain-containing protein [Candidatus Orphnella occulta]|nr:prepilin-type N-terminal cleavage/methylation domain-containing protein [Candidatus Orphnella occulta]
MSYFRKSHRGFTLIEILASTILLNIAAIAFFAVFVYTAKLRIYSTNEFRMSVNASSWLEKIRLGSVNKTKYNSLSAQTDIDLNDAVLSIFPEDYTAWIISGEGNVDITSPGGALYTIEDNIDLGSGAYFKKITVTVSWDEKA